MTLSFQNLVIIFIFVAVSVGLLQALRIGISQLLKWDIGEKERLLQQKLIEMQYETDKYKEEVADLRKQIKILIKQYDEAIIKMAGLETRYKQAMEDAGILREEIERMRKEVKEPEESANRVLIAAIGSKKAAIGLDLASLRGVEMDTGLHFERVLEATPDRLKIVLDRYRMRQAVVYLHLSIESSSEGYRLMDEVVGADWLSEVLRGVVVLMVAGSQSDKIAELVSVVPYVLSMSDNANSRDLALFARAFWTEIGRGIGPTLALQRALSRAPSGMSEYVVQHWRN